MKEVDHEDGGDRALQERLAKLAGAIEKKQAESSESDRRQAEAAAVGGETGKAMALGFRMLAELIAGVAVGAIIGWQIDRWSGLSPIFLIIFMMLGVAAGFWNMVKLGSGKSRARPMDTDPKGRND
ncbi:MAG: AtpZ/AtpI family protein [Hyphomicrobiales bacterium]|nr:AtpZ/AtpI family protein [Hyphomicrobiales bacterium]